MKHNKYRIRWIDIAKGLGIVLVVIGHVIHGFQSSGFYEDNQLYTDAAYYIYTFHMPLFMVISGLLFSSRNTIKDAEYKIKKVLLSYGIPYVVFSFVWAVSKIVLQSQTANKLTVKDMLLIPLYPISFMWFIYALLIMEIVQIIVGPSITKRFKIIHILAAWGGI